MDRVEARLLECLDKTPEVMARFFCSLDSMIETTFNSKIEINRENSTIMEIPFAPQASTQTLGLVSILSHFDIG